jgi:hypothetical protein
MSFSLWDLPVPPLASHAGSQDGLPLRGAIIRRLGPSTPTRPQYADAAPVSRCGSHRRWPVALQPAQPAGRRPPPKPPGHDGPLGAKDKRPAPARPAGRRPPPKPPGHDGPLGAKDQPQSRPAPSSSARGFVELSRCVRRVLATACEARGKPVPSRRAFASASCLGSLELARSRASRPSARQPRRLTGTGSPFAEP